MDISTSKQLIEVVIKTRTDELAIFQLASDILNDKFSADFTSLNTAQAEANQFAVEKNKAIQEKIVAETTVTSKQEELRVANETIEIKETELLSKESALQIANTTIAEKDAVIVAKDEEIAILKTPVEPLPVEELIVPVEKVVTLK